VRNAATGKSESTAQRTHAAPGKKRKVLRLTKEAFKTVEENAHGLAEALLKSAKEGKVMSAKLLVELAEEDVDGEDGMTAGPLRSLALRLAAETRDKATPAPLPKEKTTGQPAEA
jgi:hypothetical protein